METATVLNQPIISMTAANSAYLAEMLARGNYHFVNRCLRDGELIIPEGFMVNPSHRLFGFDQDVPYTGEVTIKMGLSGYDSAMFWDLLEHGVANPEADGYQNLVALGSTLELCGDTYAPGIAIRGKRRELHLFSVGTRWFAPAHFLGIVKVKGNT